MADITSIVRKLKQAKRQLRAERSELVRKISILDQVTRTLRTGAPAPSVAAEATPKKRRRRRRNNLSPAGRAAISAAQKKRWAVYRGKKVVGAFLS